MVLNCALEEGFEYSEQSPYYHQCSNQEQVYGLKFRTKEESQVFGNAVIKALKKAQMDHGSLLKCCSNFMYICQECAVTTPSHKNIYLKPLVYKGSY